MRNLTFKLFLLNAVIFPLEYFFPLRENFSLSLANVYQASWILITSMFLHADFVHFFYNMLALFMFGFILERLIGSKRFLFVYFVSGLIGGIASLIFYPFSSSLGASGAIMGVIGTLAVLRPKMMVYYGGAPLPMIVLACIWVFFDALGIFAPDNIAHAAHLGGFFLGVIFGLIWLNRFKEEKLIKEQVDKEINDKELEKWEETWMKESSKS